MWRARCGRGYQRKIKTQINFLVLQAHNMPNCLATRLETFFSTLSFFSLARHTSQTLSRWPFLYSVPFFFSNGPLERPSRLLSGPFTVSALPFRPFEKRVQLFQTVAFSFLGSQPQFNFFFAKWIFAHSQSDPDRQIVPRPILGKMTPLKAL